MARNEIVYNALRAASPEELVAFCASCADRASGIFELIHDRSEQERFDEALSLGWRAVAGEDVEDAATEVVDVMVAELDEDEEDDPHNQGFYSSQVAMLAVNTLSVYLNPAPQQAEMSGQTLETLLSDFDLTLNGGGSVVTRYGDTPRPAGELQRLEQEAQTSFTDALINGTGDRLTPTAIEELRASCFRFRAGIADRLRAVAEIKNWEVPT